MPLLINYSLLVLTVAVCTYLFLSLKHELRVLETRSLRRGEQLRAQLHELADELETMRKELEVMEQKSDPSATVARTLGSGVRIQALRMIKHGEGPGHIASALNLPRTEVELLIKVQKLMAEAEPQPTI
jgi:hypothetical protein